MNDRHDLPGQLRTLVRAVFGAASVAAAFCLFVRLAVAFVPSVYPGARTALAAAARVVFVLILAAVSSILPSAPSRDGKGARSLVARIPLPTAVLCVLCGCLLHLSLASLAALALGAENIGARAIPSCAAEVLALLSAVVITPVCEEIVFRGASYRALRHGAAFPLAALLSALLFTPIHSGAAGMTAAFVCGLILAAAVERQGSILGAIALHAAFNLTSFFAGYLPLSPIAAAVLFTPLTALCVTFTIRKGTSQ